MTIFNEKSVKLCKVVLSGIVCIFIQVYILDTKNELSSLVAWWPPGQYLYILNYQRLSLPYGAGYQGVADLVVPLEVRGDGELHFEGGACDGLQVDGQVQLGELVDVLVDGLPHLGHADQLTWKRRKTHCIEFRFKRTKCFYRMNRSFLIGIDRYQFAGWSPISLWFRS